jgi:hypothetical protein
MAAFLNYRLSLSLLAGSIFFFLFYSCYDKVVGRYAIIIPILLLPSVAICFNIFFAFVIKISKQRKRESLIRFFLYVAVISVCFLLIFRFSKGFGELLKERTYCIKYKGRIEQLLYKDDVYICFNSIIDSWTKYFTSAENFSWLLSVGNSWEIYADTDAQLKKFDAKLKGEGEAFYIERQDDNSSFKYWSKQDVNLNYEVCLFDEISPMFNDYGKILVSQITERNARERIVKYSEDSETPTKLLLWTADASLGATYKQNVVFASRTFSITNKLISGINIYDIPSGCFDKESELKMTAIQNLPVVIDAIAFSTNATVVFQSYENMPAALLTLPGTKPFWHGRYHWWRESRKRGEYLNPLMAIPQSIKFPVNGEITKITLRVATIGEMKSSELLSNLAKLRLNDGNVECRLSIDVVSWRKRGNRRIIVADLSTDEFVLENDTSGFEIDLRTAGEASIFLESISFSY